MSIFWKPRRLVAGFAIIFVILCVDIAQGELILQRKFSLGGQLTSGNTQVQSLHLDFSLNRNNKWVDETTFKASLDQEFSAGTQSQFKVYSFLRYGKSLSKKYYSFGKLEAEHDRFQNIDVRIVPTLGVGYWFADEKGFKSMLETAFGYQRQYLINKTSDEMVVLALNSIFLLGDFSNNLNVYVAANDLNNFRLTNTTKFKVKLNQNYAFKWMLKDEYNNQPTTGVQKNDVSFTTSLEYAFKEVKS